MGFPFDAVQMPLNPFDATFLSFEQAVLPEPESKRHCPARYEADGWSPPSHHDGRGVG